MKKLYKSNVVVGAFAHAFRLEEGESSVLVVLHAKVKNPAELQTACWRVRLVIAKKNELHLCLKPAKEGEKPTLGAIQIEEKQSKKDKEVTVRFEVINQDNARQRRRDLHMTHLDRRLRLAGHEADRL